MVTIYDIAKITGFSAPTISKALNGNGKLNPQTRAKILEAAKQAGYQPNMAAKSLTTKRSKLIGVILEDQTMMRGFEHPLFGGLLNKFRKDIENAGYDLLFLSKTFNGGMSYINHCKFRNVDGIIVVNPKDDDTEIEDLGKAGISCVSTNEFIPGVCTIVSENFESGEYAAREFVKAGHKKIGFLGAPYRKASPASLERFNGFKKGLQDLGVGFDGDCFQQCDYWHEKAGFDGMKKLYTRRPDITAVFAVCDTIAYGAMQFLTEIDKKVPEDVSFIGFDDDAVVSDFKPFLSTFRQNREKIAELSAEMLLQLMQGIPGPEVVRVPTFYISRSSVKTL